VADGADLSVVLLTRNEAARSRRCLDSVRWVGELVVVDQHSTDGTPAFCAEYGARPALLDGEILILRARRTR
jgi:glycosyltransferase involved in cell wall biosynthesis